MSKPKERAVNLTAGVDLSKLNPGEIVFVLRAQDKLAPNLIRTWANRAKKHGASWRKVESALNIADEMERWPGRRYPD